MRWTSGWLISIDRAICFITVVLPAFGGDTMRPRWPFPIGEIRSMIRAVMFVGSSASSILSFWSGNNGVRSSKRRRSRAWSGSLPLTASMRSSAGFFSLRPAGRLAPVRWSPLRRPNCRTCFTETYTSSFDGEVAVHPEEAVALVAQVEPALDVDGLAVERLGAWPAVAALALALLAALAAGPGPGRRPAASRSRLRSRPRRRRRRLPGSPSSSRCWLLALLRAALARRLRRGPTSSSQSARRLLVGRLVPGGQPHLGLGQRRAGVAVGVGPVGRRRRGAGGLRSAPARRSAAGTPASCRIWSTRSAFLAREVALPPMASTMAASSARSFCSSFERSSACSMRSFPRLDGSTGSTAERSSCPRRTRCARRAPARLG